LLRRSFPGPGKKIQIIEHRQFHTDADGNVTVDPSLAKTSTGRGALADDLHLRRRARFALRRALNLLLGSWAATVDLADSARVTDQS